MIQPEYIVLAASGLWLGAAFVTGAIYKGRFPPELPLLYTIIAFVGGAIGITELVPENVDTVLTVVAAATFAVTPVVFTIYLFHAYPPDPPPSRPRRLGN